MGSSASQVFKFDRIKFTSFVNDRMVVMGSSKSRVLDLIKFEKYFENVDLYLFKDPFTLFLTWIISLNNFAFLNTITDAKKLM